MPKVSKRDAGEHVALEGFEGHYGEAADVTIGFGPTRPTPISRRCSRAFPTTGARAGTGGT